MTIASFMLKKKPIKPCIAFESQGRSVHVWRPCGRPARRDSVFCRLHERLIAGVMLGICVHDTPDGVQHREPRSLMDLPSASKVPS